jgi:hypothetical protein
MKKENVEAAFTAVKTLIIEKKYGQYYDSDWYKRLEEVDNIDTLLEVCGWETEVENYDIVGLRFDGENYNSDDIILFIALAPYIEAGSYIQIETSDFQKFEWYFDGYTVVRKEGMVDFDSNIEIVEALLKDKKLLPQLLGIHPELDKRIAEVLKG